MRHLPLAVTFLLVAGSMTRALSPPTPRYAEADLPVGGTFVADRADGTRFYVVPADAIGRHAANAGRKPGLYRSDPGGDGKFFHLSGLDFRQVLVQPGTHRLFALVQWTQPVPCEPGGPLVLQSHVVLATSAFGDAWRDVTPPDTLLQRGASMRTALAHPRVRIIADPDHPRRVCVCVDPGPRSGFVLRAADDDHSTWELIPGRQWRQEYPTDPE